MMRISQTFLMLTLTLCHQTAYPCFTSAPDAKCTRLASVHGVTPPKLWLNHGDNRITGLPGEFCWKEYKGVIDGRGWPSANVSTPISTMENAFTFRFEKELELHRIEYRLWSVDKSMELPSTVKNQKRWAISPKRSGENGTIEDISKFTLLDSNLKGEYILVINVFWQSRDFSTYTYYLSARK